MPLHNAITINFSNNVCSGGQGISVGSIAAGKTVSGVTISGNTVTNSQNGLRIKVDSDATSASVSGVTYSGNTLSGITDYGVLITESYPDSFGTPGTGAKISGINFTGSKTTVAVDSSATRVAIDCGSGACTGAILLPHRRGACLLRLHRYLGLVRALRLWRLCGQDHQLQRYHGILSVNKTTLCPAVALAGSHGKVLGSHIFNADFPCLVLVAL